MHYLRHFYYENKDKIWKVVLIIAFFLGAIYLLNANSIEMKNSGLQNTDTKAEIYSDEENKTYISDTSAISGGTVSKNDVEKINNTISKFLQHCKNENFEEAYNLVSNDCKGKKYPTLEKFTTRYVKPKFKKDYVYEIEEWLGDTYRVSISEDMLATGKVSNGEKLVEYITIVEEDSQDKLNIGYYVGKANIGKEVTQENVKITVINKEIYLDYEIYNFKVENLSDKTIKLDALEKTNTMYLEDSNGNNYTAYSHELLEEELVILPKRNCEISIKYATPLSSNRNIRKIAFSNFILEYKEEQTEQELSEFVIKL